MNIISRSFDLLPEVMGNLVAKMGTSIRGDPIMGNVNIKAKLTISGLMTIPVSACAQPAANQDGLVASTTVVTTGATAVAAGDRGFLAGHWGAGATNCIRALVFAATATTAVTSSAIPAAGVGGGISGTFPVFAQAAIALTPLVVSTSAWAAPVQTFVAASAPQDALTDGFGWYLEKADSLSPSTFNLFVRVAILLIAQTIVCGAIFANSRKFMSHGILVVLQWLASLGVFFLVMQIPLDGISLSRGAKGFVLAISQFAILVLPWRLSWLLVPTAGHRKVAAIIIYSALLILFTAQFLRSL